MLDEKQNKELEDFLTNWQDNEKKNKQAFLRLKKFLEDKQEMDFEFKARPKVTYSLRAAYAKQKNRPLFALIDVIDDDPQDRWLSVCFYADLIDDPEELGDMVPEGLMGEDACCFDVDFWDEKLLSYIETRLDQAYNKAQDL